LTEKLTYEELEDRVKELEAIVNNPASKTFEHLFNHSLDILCVVDAETDLFKLTNPAFAKTLGHKNDGLKECHFLHHVHPDDQSLTMEALKQLSKGTPVTYFENRCQCEDGSYKWLAWTATPAPEDGVTYAVARDITDHKAADQALSESEQRFKTIFNSAEDGILITDKQSQEFITGNEGMARMLGYSAEEFAQMQVSDLHRNEDLPYVLEQFNQGAEGAINKVQCLPFKRKDGSVVYMDITGFPVVIDGKEYLGGIFRDTTERKKAEEALQKAHDDLERRVIERTKELQNAKELLQTLIDALPDVVYFKDANFRHLAVNRACNEYLGLEEGEALGKTNKDILPPYLYEHCQKDDENILRCGKPILCEEGQFTNEEGKQVFLETTKIPLHDENGNARGLVGVTRDITRRKKAEQELMAAKYEAERANSAKSEFLSRMSHELRTPLNAILGFSQLLHLDEELMDEEQRESVGHIIEAGGHLLYLINEVLDIAKIDAQQMQLSLEDFPLDGVFSSALMLVKNLALKKGVTIRELPTEMPWVHADGKRLKQIMINLLSNAIKYNCKGGTVTISFADAPEGRVRINITDTGIGIKPEDQVEVFEPFYRVALKGELVEGTGIGLSVVKKLVEAMGGRIGVQSEYGQGSTFWAELPQVQPVAAELTDEDVAALSAIALNSEQGVQKILYVEDNPVSLDLMQLIFKKLLSYELLSASTAEQGLDIAQEQHPGLILMDLDLPGMDGFEALEKLRANHETADIPVIAVSAHAMSEHVSKGINAGFIDYITKPIQVDQLMSTLKRAF